MTKRAAAYPYLVMMVIFIVVPMILIIYYSFTSEVGGRVVFTFDNYLRVVGSTYRTILWRSIKLALICTVICFFLGYPVAYILAEKERSATSMVMFLFLVPMWMNYLLRTYAWLSILESNGLLNTLLSYLRLAPLEILYTDAAVVLGMVYNYLPFMILPIYTVLSKMDDSIIEAAEDLGADSARVFTKIVFPLSIPGVVSGVTMVFMPAVTTFVISNLLGGGQTMLIGNLIEQQFVLVGDKNFGSAISFILMVIIFIAMGVFSLADNDNEGGGLF